MELRLIAEKLRNRFTVPSRLEGTAWNPKVMELPPGRRFLVISPHPDDDAIGCGGSIIKLVGSGAQVRVVYLTIQNGNFTRERRREEVLAALAELNVQDHRLLEAAFPAPPEVAGIIEEEISAYRPDAVFLPSPFENHDQHLRVFESFAPAAPRWHGDVILYEVWGPLMPNLLVPVSGVMERKLAAIRRHGTQLEDIDYIRAVQGLNGYRATASGLKGYAEAFIFLPADDLLRLFH